eukprot:CAMPEP_0197842296 /NCGR_PEP_ID=MMETSP1437-20131217/46659_1 /TAXON_ID=49252 ORGANISM="Eucampia antarctica, Strain CCMP1452" /NCGR_SAMPLE_ID=MMETSP1437 /ASSEMBLY_ACC=CAM_ASM_001096 /LENGTH=241 /DNA_ID=CAMNT_0043452153 /DNA_START=120 /DNA_END=845 /DNA_ORIENTATION=+
MNADGTWTLEEIENISQSDISADALKKEAYSNSGIQKISIKAGEVNHLPGIQTFGYAVEEAPFERRIDIGKAQACGISPGPKFRLLKKGFPVKMDETDQMIQPDQVLIPNTVRPRKFALLGDNCAISKSMESLIQGVDVLVQEATIIGENGGKDSLIRGHSTPSRAGKMACESKANVLLLNHISCSVQMDEVNELIVQVAKETNNGVSEVVAAFDFLELNVPRGGYNFHSTSKSTSGDRAK